MCTIIFAIESNTCKIDDKDLNTNDFCEKSEPIFKMDDALVRNRPVYASFLDNSPMRQTPIKVLREYKRCLANEFSDIKMF